MTSMELSIKDIFVKHDLLNIYAYGSRVYGNNSPEADYDFIAVVEGNAGLELNQTFITTQPGSSHKYDFTIYDRHNFTEKLAEHEISILECICLPEHFILQKTVDFSWTLDLNKLRESLSAKSSNSFVKAKKKFDVEKEPYIAKKSLWHSLRILRFGIQIATQGKITNYAECNDLWTKILDNPSSWEDYKQKYQSLYNQYKTEFRKVAPK